MLTERDEAYAAIAAVREAFSEVSITSKLDRREIEARADAMIAFRAAAMGIEIAAAGIEESWQCWVRADYAGRYTRFVHLRHITTREDLIFLLEGIVGRGFDRDDVYCGIWMAPGRAAKARGLESRLDRRIMRERPWRSIERDDTRGRALPEHMQAHETQQGRGGEE